MDTPTNSADWADTLDNAANSPTVGVFVSLAFANGHAVGVPIAYDKDDNDGRILVSADHSMAVEYMALFGYWVAVDPGSVPTIDA